MLDPRAEIMTLAEWRALQGSPGFAHYDGAGKFVRNGGYMTEAPRDDVFGPPPTGATHVAWLNRWRNAHTTSPPPMPVFADLKPGG